MTPCVLCLLCGRHNVSDSYGPAVKNLLTMYNITASSVSASGPHSRLLKGWVLSSPSVLFVWCLFTALGRRLSLLTGPRYLCILCVWTLYMILIIILTNKKLSLDRVQTRVGHCIARNTFFALCDLDIPT